MKNLLLVSVLKETWDLFKKNILFLFFGSVLSAFFLHKVGGLLLLCEGHSVELAIVSYSFFCFTYILLMLGWLKIFLDLVSIGTSSYLHFFSLKEYARFIIGFLIPFSLLMASCWLLTVLVGVVYVAVTRLFNFNIDFIFSIAIYGLYILLLSPLIFLFFIGIDQKTSFLESLKKSYQLAGLGYLQTIFITFLFGIILYFNRTIVVKIGFWLLQASKDGFTVMPCVIVLSCYCLLINLFLGLLVAVLYKKLMQLHKEAESSIY